MSLEKLYQELKNVLFIEINGIITDIEENILTTNFSNTETNIENLLLNINETFEPLAKQFIFEIRNNSNKYNEILKMDDKNSFIKKNNEVLFFEIEELKKNINNFKSFIKNHKDEIYQKNFLNFLKIIKETKNSIEIILNNVYITYLELENSYLRKNLKV